MRVKKRAGREGCMTRLSLAVGIVVGSVGYRVHRAKEQGDAGQEAGGQKERRKGSPRKDGKRRKQKAIAYERQLAPLIARENKTKERAKRRAQTNNKAHTRAEKRGRRGGGRRDERRKK